MSLNSSTGAIMPTVGGKVIMTTTEGGGHVPAFLTKLWKIVDDTSIDDLICWNENGSSFIIKDQSKFARDLLPLYYKHNNMASFVRQLNMYGFHKVVSVEQGGLKLEKDEMEFAHPFFLRGHEDALELIKRKMPATKHEGEGGSSENITKVLPKVITDVRQIKGRQDTMDSKLITIKRENEALWRELSALRQKHAKQQQIVSKLLQFLVSLMSSQQHRIPYKRHLPQLMIDEFKGSVQGPSRTKRSKSNILLDEDELLDVMPTSSGRALGGSNVLSIEDVMPSPSNSENEGYNVTEADDGITIEDVDAVIPTVTRSNGNSNPLAIENMVLQSVDALNEVPTTSTSGSIPTSSTDDFNLDNLIDSNDGEQIENQNTNDDESNSNSLDKQLSPENLDFRLDEHLNEVESGLSSMRDLLKNDTSYNLDESQLIGVSDSIFGKSFLFGDNDDLLDFDIDQLNTPK